MSEYIQVLSSSDNLNEVPDWIKILPLGNVSSEKGNFLVDRESYNMIHSYMLKRKIDIVIDYEHQTLTNGQAPAGGWIKELALKADGIYAKVEWTEKAKSYLRNKEYRYLSPVIMVRKSDNRVTELHSVALTNCPAINGMTPIVNSLKGINENQLDKTLQHILKMTNISYEDFIKYGGI